MDFESGWDLSVMARNVWNDTGINSLYNSAYTSAEHFGDPRWRNERTSADAANHQPERPQAILTTRKSGSDHHFLASCE